ncbi:MAG TPA: transcriptional activator RfaH [Schlesneria sp.]
MAASVPLPRDGARWYVVHTQPAAEYRAVINLERQGYRVFCPRLRKTVRHARKQTVKLAAFFPCYLFLKLDILRDRWRSVGGTRGVVRLISLGDVPQPVPGGVIEEIRARADSEGVIDWMPALEAGSNVCVTEGPFQNFVGRLEQLDGSGRARVLLDLLGRSVPAELHRQVLTPVA